MGWGVTNRNFEKGKLFNTSGGHDVFFEYAGKRVLIDSIGQNANEFYFQMPEGLDEETLFSIAVEDYHAQYEQPLKNTTLNFEYLTSFDRSYRSGIYVIATPGFIYLGGGADANNKALTDFWKYDITTKLWSRIADLPIGGRDNGMAFSIGDNIYFGAPDRLLQYNAQSNSWKFVPEPTNNLQYDHTFSTAASAVYDGKSYIAKLSSPKIGNTYLKNFWRFDPVTETYTELPDYPGETLTSNYPSTPYHAVVYQDDLHFFRNMQHWRYSPIASSWARLADIDKEGKETRSFTFKGELYGIVTNTVPDPLTGGNGKSYSLYAYNDHLDTWTADTDVPRITRVLAVNTYASSFRMLQADANEVYLCQAEGGRFFTFYTIKY